MSTQVSVVFLILHFMNEKLTYRAVDTLKQLNRIDECKIVIVDNGSPNESGRVIAKKYKNDPIVDIIILEENRGFSSGNNAGAKYIKNNYNFDFVVVMNNDVFIYQPNFIDNLYCVYKEENFRVAGPDIYVPQNVWHSSPLRKELMDKKAFIKYVRSWENKYQKMQQSFCVSTYKAYILDRLKDKKVYELSYKLNRKLRGQKEKWYKVRQYDCVLQGACIIFDSVYMEMCDKFFYPETFLYSEEDILTYRCIQNNLKVVYFPELQVYHTSQGSSRKKKESYKNFKNKKAIEFQRILNSLHIFANMQNIDIFNNQDRAICNERKKAD